ncbi:MAG: pro-sigmaK processing inhibitor BofA family protein [Clostridia bacterium]
MEYVIFIGCLVAIFIIAKVLSWPFKVIFKLILNILFGILLIVLVNTFGINFGLHIPFNTVTSLTAGILGIPGVILLIIVNYIF